MAETPPPVTQADVDKIANDFNTLVDDITAKLPDSMALEVGLMAFHSAENIIVTLLKRHMATT